MMTYPLLGLFCLIQTPGLDTAAIDALVEKVREEKQVPNLHSVIVGSLAVDATVKAEATIHTTATPRFTPHAPRCRTT